MAVWLDCRKISFHSILLLSVIMMRRVSKLLAGKMKETTVAVAEAEASAAYDAT